ncbi:MAG: hypothetical protein JKY95_06785 [Planctomycetaceae bacterium]|nr:hypothetical protein [Planctomycetaceae bacterium]
MATKNTVTSSTNDDELLDLKKNWLAAVLTWLIPGAGQIYQGRTFKGVLFGICILGMFFCGVQMGEGRPVYCYYESETGDRNRLVMRHRNYGYISQFLVGLPSIPALIQSKRFDSPANTYDLDRPIKKPFEGVVRAGVNGQQQEVVGLIELKMEPGPSGPELTGKLSGTLQASGESVELELIQSNGGEYGYPSLGRKIAADPQRLVSLEIAKVVQGPEGLGRDIMGTIPRPFHNWYQVPLQDSELQDMNARLGKRWELAMVFTWIAGLLNILAIWDAYEGPAYGLRPLIASAGGEGESSGNSQASQPSGPNTEKQIAEPVTTASTPNRPEKPSSS